MEEDAVAEEVDEEVVRLAKRVKADHPNESQGA